MKQFDIKDWSVKFMCQKSYFSVLFASVFLVACSSQIANQTPNILKNQSLVQTSIVGQQLNVRVNFPPEMVEAYKNRRSFSTSQATLMKFVEEVRLVLANQNGTFWREAFLTPIQPAITISGLPAGELNVMLEAWGEGGYQGGGEFLGSNITETQRGIKTTIQENVSPSPLELDFPVLATTFPPLKATEPMVVPDDGVIPSNPSDGGSPPINGTQPVQNTSPIVQPIPSTNTSPVIQSMSATPSSASIISGGVQNIQLKAEATDQDNDPLTYTWFSNGVQIRSGKTSDFPFGGGAHRIRLDVQDSKGAVTSQESTVQINEAPAPYTYVLESSSTGNGGGTWNDILKLEAVISGGRIYFSATKKDGGAFQQDGTVYLKVGTYESFGVNHAKYPISANNPTISLSDNLNEYKTGWPKQFYIRVENPSGFAWVGPLTVNRY